MKNTFTRYVEILSRWPVAGLLILQITLSLCLEYTSPWTLLLLLFTTLGLGIVHHRHHKQKRFIAFAVLTLVSLCWHKIYQNPLDHEALFKKASYRAVIIAEPRQVDGHTQIVVDLKQRLTSSAEKTRGRVMITIGASCPLLQGDAIKFTAKINRPKSYKNPGGFDYGAHLRQDNIWGKGFVEDCGSIRITHRSTRGMRNKLRDKILWGIDNVPHLDHRNVLSALLLGTRSIGKGQGETIRRAGLSHLFAISGSHFGIMCALIYFVVSLITGLLPQIYLVISRQKIAALFTLLFVMFYMFVVLPTPSILRSGIMIATYLFALLCDRQKNILYVMLLSAAIILWARPLDLFDVSFQLSYLCVLILVLVYPFIAKPFAKYQSGTRSGLALSYMTQVFIISLLINIMLLPLVLLRFGSSPLNAFVNNIWAVPYFEFIVIPLTLLYLFASLLIPPVVAPILMVWDKSIGIFFPSLMRSRSSVSKTSASPHPTLST